MSMIAQVARLAYEGRTDIQIAEELNASIETVRSLSRRVNLRYRGGHRKDMTKLGFLVKLSKPALAVLMIHAASRDCRPTDLSERILETVLRGSLVEAALDDGGML